MGVPRTAVLPRLARRQGPVQADGPRGSVGGTSAAPAHGGVLNLPRPPCQSPLGPYPVPGLLVCSPGALDAVRPGIGQLLHQSRRQHEPGVQGVLPTAAAPDRVRGLVPDRLRDRPRRAFRDHGGLRPVPRVDGSGRAPTDPLTAPVRVRGSDRALSTQRALSRRCLRVAARHPAMAVRHSRGLPCEPRTRVGTGRLRSQPDGWRPSSTPR